MMLCLKEPGSPEIGKTMIGFDNRLKTIKRFVWVLVTVLIMETVAGIFCADVRACYYYKDSDVLYCKRKGGCNDEELAYAKHVVIDTRLTAEGIEKIRQNENLETLTVKDLSLLSQEDLITIYPYLVKGNPALAAVLFSYEDYYESFGNDGTDLYRHVMKKYCPSITTLRSCATVVSAALNSAGLMNYSSAATAGLVEYFETHSDWICIGQVSDNEILRPGDVIFIDRKSHAAEYESGEMEDPEFKAEEEYVYEYTGGYDSTGHKNYETQDPTGSSYEVFCPDQDGDGEVGEWEAEYWKCYWERVNTEDHYVPPYDYYYVWEDEAKKKEEEEKAEREAKKREEEEQKQGTRKRKAAPARIIHDHIFIWTDNDVIRQVFPSSTGNIISGSYTENYVNARSAAVSKYNFTGDYRVYRYIGKVSPYEMTLSENEIPVATSALKLETWKHGKDGFSKKGKNSYLRAVLSSMRIQSQSDSIEKSVSNNASVATAFRYSLMMRKQKQERSDNTWLSGNLDNLGAMLYSRTPEVAEGEAFSDIIQDKVENYEFEGVKRASAGSSKTN